MKITIPAKEIEITDCNDCPFMSVEDDGKVTTCFCKHEESPEGYGAALNSVSHGVPDPTPPKWCPIFKSAEQKEIEQLKETLRIREQQLETMIHQIERQAHYRTAFGAAVRYLEVVRDTCMVNQPAITAKVKTWLKELEQMTTSGKDNVNG